MSDATTVRATARGERMREKWKDPDYRARMLDAARRGAATTNGRRRGESPSPDTSHKAASERAEVAERSAAANAPATVVGPAAHDAPPSHTAPPAATGNVDPATPPAESDSKTTRRGYRPWR